MLKQRIITALALLAILLPALFWPSPLPFAVVAMALMTAGAWEWGRLNGLGRVGAILTGFACFAMCSGAWFLGLLAKPLPLLWTAAGAAWVLAGAFLLRGGVAGWPKIPRAARLAGGVLALWLAWLAGSQGRMIGINFMLSVLVLVWAADVFAYFAGRALGGKFSKTRLAPAISPNKSWEGVWGGLAGVLVLAVVWTIADASLQAAVPSLYTRLGSKGWLLLVIGVLFMAAMSVVGDLVESLIKRSVGVKDSSGMLPGHGGMLDRVDALLPALPLAMMLASFTRDPRVRSVMKQRVAVLGSTGSVGTSTLDVIARHPGRFEVFALSANTQVEPMLAQCARFQPQFAVMADEAAGRELAQKLQANRLATRVLWAPSAIETIASHEAVDTVMAAIVGAAGLASCMAAAGAGKRLLLANKEALVVGGALFMQAVKAGGATLLPIDSEHSAILQSLPEDPASWDARVDKIILTASGGPFRTRAPATLRDVTPEEACAHPTWVMGRKISVDSATMMNKALEVIEACFLFGLPPQRLEVVIHPQSVVHSMVQYRDSSVVAQLGTPDMRVPIAYGLAWPDRVASGAQALDFSALADMSFESLDSRGHRERFPGLQLAWDSLRAPQGTTAVLNAANEVAVAAFLARRIRFDQIHGVNLATLAAVAPSKPGSLDELLALDALARQAADQAVARLAH